MIGIGIQAAGLTLAGLGDPEDTVTLPTPGRGSPFLSPSGDYQIDPRGGDIARETSARHRVMLALRTVRRSANADPGFGIGAPTVITERFDSEMTAAVTLALRPCTSDGSVRIDGIHIKRGVGSQGRAIVTVEFTDLHTMAQDKATI